MKSLITLLLLTCSISISAQNYYDLYIKFIPENHLSYYSREALEQQLSADASLSPEIIYWRLLYFNNLMANKDSNNRTNGLDYCRYLTKEKITEKNAWINKQVDLLENKADNDSKEKLKRNLLNKVIVPKIIPAYNPPGEYSVNMDYFYRYIAASQKNNIIFDPNANYSKLLEEEYEKIYKEIAIFAQSDDPDSLIEPSVLADEIVRGWFLLNEKYSFVNMAEIYNNYLGNMNVIKKENQLSIQLGYERKFHEISDVSLSFPGTVYLIDLASVEGDDKFSIKLSHKYFIRQINSYFSYIKSSLYLATSSLSFTPKAKAYFSKIEQRSASEFTYDYFLFKEYKPGNGRSYTVSLEFSTPIFVLSENIYLECGFSSQLEMTKPEFDLVYNYERTKIENNGGTISGKKLAEDINARYNYNKTDYELYISPLLSISYEMYKFLTIETYASIKGVGISAGIIF